MGRYISCTERTFHGKDFELILTVKMETRHPVERHFVVNVRRSVIVAELCGLKSQDLEILWAIFALFGKRTPYGKIFKILFRKFSLPHRSTLLCSNVVKFVRWEIGEIVRYLPDQKKEKIRLPLKLSLVRGSRPKSARTSPHQCAHSAPDFIQIGSLSAEL